MQDFLSFVAEVFRVEVESLSLATVYGTPPWDSVMQLRLVMEIEECYGIDIPLEQVAELKTLESFYRLISSAGEV